MQENKQIILALDSSSAPLVLALSADGKKYISKHGGIKQEEYLFSAIHKLFAKAGLKFNQTTHFFFVKGPGRFTGIRIGITLASMLGSLLNVKISSADIFEILKYQADNSSEYKKWAAQNPSGVLAVVIHAFREEYFACIYDGANKPLWLSREDLLSLIAEQTKPVFAVGWDKDQTPLGNLLPQGITLASKKINFVQPSSMLSLAQIIDRPSEKVLEPLYLKPARFELEHK